MTIINILTFIKNIKTVNDLQKKEGTQRKSRTATTLGMKIKHVLIATSLVLCLQENRNIYILLGLEKDVCHAALSKKKTCVHVKGC